MAKLLDSDALRVVGYFLAAAAAMVAGERERRARAVDDAGEWQIFWYLGAVLLGLMGLAQVVDLGGIIADAGRDQARSRSWYGIRRSYQAVAVGLVAVAWGAGVLVSIWRVPERRRRYLPTAILLFTVMCFAAIRVVSLHQIDTLLYRRSIEGVRIVALAELALLTAVAVSTIWFPFVRRPGAGSGKQSGPPKLGTRFN